MFYHEKERMVVSSVFCAMMVKGLLSCALCCKHVTNYKMMKKSISDMIKGLKKSITKEMNKKIYAHVIQMSLKNMLTSYLRWITRRKFLHSVVDHAMKSNFKT